MAAPRLSLIVAVDEQRAIGKDNHLLWHIPEDLRRFKAITTGHVVVMGENTFRSIGRPLPHRTNIVMTLSEKADLPGCIIAHSVDEAIALGREREREEIFVIGGASIYQQFLPFADRLYLTRVAGKYAADTFFPDYSDFSVVVSEEPCDNGEYQFTFFVLERPSKSQ
jgi:dihydrofolate reductase